LARLPYAGIRMKKTTVAFTIDIDVWEAFKAQTQDRTRSKIINDFLATFANTKGTTREQQALQVEIDKLIAKREEIADALNTLTAELIKRKEEDEQAERETLEQQNAMYDSVMANNPLDRD